jgi:hypothetical protein
MAVDQAVRRGNSGDIYSGEPTFFSVRSQAMTENIGFSCASCGCKEFNFPANPQPDDTVTCVGCGASNRYDEIQKLAAKLSQEAVTDIVRDALKNLKGLKFE